MVVSEKKVQYLYGENSKRGQSRENAFSPTLKNSHAGIIHHFVHARGSDLVERGDGKPTRRTTSRNVHRLSRPRELKRYSRAKWL